MKSSQAMKPAQMISRGLPEKAPGKRKKTLDSKWADGLRYDHTTNSGE